MRRLTIFVALLVLSTLVPAQERLLTIDDIFDPQKKIDFSGAPVTGLKWMKDGRSYIQTKGGGGRGRGSGGGSRELLKVDAATGRAEPLLDAARMQAALARLGGISADDAERLAAGGSFEFNSDYTGLLLRHANDLFYYDVTNGRAARLTNDPAEESEQAFSPDGQMVSFVRNNNIYVVDLASGRERALTQDGGPKTLNGRLDWLYQEEIYGRGTFRAYWWSPDSSRVAFLRLDEAQVPEFSVVDHIPRRQEVEQELYPKAGDPNPHVRLGIVPAAGGRTVWADISSYDPNNLLIVRVAWTPDSKNVAFQAQDREQTWLDLNYAAAADGKVKRLLKETSKAWVSVIENPSWLKDGSFLWLSERSGWQHLYLYSAEGKMVRQVTEGRWEVDKLHGVDESNQLVYFSGTEYNPVQMHVYRVKLDGTGLTRLSRTPGRHTANFNESFTQYLDTWSDITTPSQVRLHGADGTQVRVVDENRVAALAQFKLGKPELRQVKASDGFPMEAMMIKPPDFDPKKKYPVMSFLYGGPHAPQVQNSWGGSTYMWRQLLAQKGYVIWVCDNRTASGKGAESTWPAYKNFGELEVRDQQDCLGWLKKQPYIDGSRVGVWGWSYGGFMVTSLLTQTNDYRVGIAGGSVTDWRLYDSVYTERYMRTPQNNPEGYRTRSPVHFAAKLSGKILLVHGLMDDNVHVQNTIQFAYELQKANKRFELMLYPKSRHSVSDPALVKHMYTMMTEFVLGNL